MVRTGYVYKLVCSDVEITECYVGSTTNLRIRKNEHKSCCNNANSKKYNLPVYQFIRDHGGFQNWVMVAVCELEFEARMELNACEREWIENLKATLNRIVPTRTDKEYRLDNADKKKQYRKDNVVEIKQKANQKHECDCGGRYTHSHISEHAKSKHHQEFERFMNLPEAEMIDYLKTM
jgi:hypothetical protein